MSDQKVEQSDADEINHKADLIAEVADRIRTKAFLLRDLQKPTTEGKMKKVESAEDFASAIKNRLDAIQSMLDEAVESLTRFAG